MDGIGPRILLRVHFSETWTACGLTDPTNETNKINANIAKLCNCTKKTNKTNPTGVLRPGAVDLEASPRDSCGIGFIGFVVYYIWLKAPPIVADLLGI